LEQGFYVASIALDDYDAKAKTPISVHPAFPAIVALWFSALLGVGSLVLPAILLERFVVGTGIAALVPAAAPPLGITARGLIALTAAIVGAVIGLVVARRVAAAHRPKPESRISKLSAGARRPLSIKDELSGQKPIKDDSLPISRRRALAISEDERPSDFLYRAPLPGQDPDAPEVFIDGHEEDTFDEPLELCTPAEDEFATETTAEVEPEPGADEDYPMIERQEFQPVSPFQQFEAPEPEPETVDELDQLKNLAGPRGLEPLPFSAPSLARLAPEPESLEEFEPEHQVFEAPRVVFEPVPAAEVAPEQQADWENAPLEGLGLVQLVQRLGSTIERRREWLATAAPAFAPTPAPVHVAPVEFDAAPAEEAAQAMAAYFSSAPQPEAELVDVETFEDIEAEPEVDEADEAAPAPRPDFLRSIQSFDDDDEDEGLPDFSLPLRSAAPSFAAPVNDAGDEPEEADEEEAGEEEAAESDAGYSSLLGMKNPFVQPKQEFVRVDEPEVDEELPEPTVVFPGQEQRERFSVPVSVNGSRLFDPPGKGVAPAAAAAQPAPADADAQLRAALATLQKMSGAA
jgi:hypothetical protein